MRRREFIALFSSSAILPQVARAQPRPLPLIGILAPDRPPFAGYDALLESLRGLGQIEGLTHVRETRWAEGQRIDLYRQYAKELDGRGAHVVVTGDTPGTIAAHEVSKTTPIVMAFLGAGDPIELGFAASLARPGGNVTGIYSQTDVLAGKRLQILRETLPSANRVAVLHVSVETARRAALAHGAPAEALGLEIQSIEVSKPEDFDAGFAAAKQWHADAVLLTQSAVFYRNLALLAETAMRHKMPALSGETGFAAAGGLMDQGPDIAEAWRRSAIFVDKILKGSSPADLPIEQPT